jgi:uncharacterized protein
MKKNVILLILLLLTSSSVFSQVSNKNYMISKVFLNLLLEKKYEKAYSYFDNQMKSALTVKKLEESWIDLNKQVGKFKKNTGQSGEIYGNYQIVYQTCQFEKMVVDLKVVFNAESKISGLFFVQPKSN